MHSSAIADSSWRVKTRPLGLWGGLKMTAFVRLRRIAHLAIEVLGRGGTSGAGVGNGTGQAGRQIPFCRFAAKPPASLDFGFVILEDVYAIR